MSAWLAREVGTESPTIQLSLLEYDIRQCCGLCVGHSSELVVDRVICESCKMDEQTMAGTKIRLVEDEMVEEI